MSNCYKCGVDLTDTRKSGEHIIPNAIGGVWKSKNLLCKKCNQEFGDTLDAELSEDLHPIAALLNIERQRGKHKPIKNVKSESGELYHLVDGRTPVSTKPIVELNKEANAFHIRANNDKELRLLIKQLKNKYPNLDDKNIEEKAQRSREYMNESLIIPMQIGGETTNRAILKIVVSAWIEVFKDKGTIQSILDILNDPSAKASSLVNHYYTSELLPPNTSEEVAHLIYFKGDPKLKLLYAYVELFSSYAFVININTDYIGEALEFCYHYDVLKKQKSHNLPNIRYEGKLPETRDLNSEFITLLQMKLGRVLNIADKRQTHQHGSSLVSEAVNKAFSKYPEGTTLTEEILQSVASEVSQKLAPYILHLNNKKERAITKRQ